MSTTVLDHRFYVPLQLHGSTDANRRELSGSHLLGHLANQLLAFDSVVIPTMDFAVAPYLAERLGASLLIDLLQSGAVQFIRRPGMLGYVGAGNGISQFLVQETDAAPFSLAQRAMWAGLDEAVPSQFELSELVTAEQRTLVPATIAATQEWNPSTNEVFIDQVERQTYRDVLASHDLQAAIRGFDGPLSDGGPIDLKRLPSVGPDKVQAVMYGDPTNAAQVLLQVAEANLQLLMAAECQSTDLYTQTSMERVLARRIQDAGAPSAKGEGLVRVVDLVGVPDLGLAIESGAVSFSALTEVRDSSAGRQFREWLRELNPVDPQDVQRAVVEDLLSEVSIDRRSVRALRIVATVGLGLLNPAAGVAASLTDGVIADRMAKGWRPRVFLKRVQEMAGRN